MNILYSVFRIYYSAFRIPHSAFRIFLLFAFASSFAAAQTPEDAIIARVNGDAVLLSQLKEAALDQDVPPSALLLAGMSSPAYRKALTQLVDETLLVQKAGAVGLKPNDMEIAKDVEQMLGELRDQLGSQARLDEFLKQHHLGLPALRALMTERERKRSLATEVVAQGMSLDEAAVEEFKKDAAFSKEPLEEVNLAQILVDCTPGERAGERGAELRQEAMKAAREAGTVKLKEMPAFVKKYETVAAGSARGVLLGWLDTATLRPELRDAAAKLSPGEVAPPLETSDGIHVLILLGRHSTHDLAFAAEFRKTRERMLDQLRREATIQVYDLNGREIKVDLGLTTQTAPRPVLPALPTPKVPRGK